MADFFFNCLLIKCETRSLLYLLNHKNYLESFDRDLKIEAYLYIEFLVLFLNLVPGVLREKKFYHFFSLYFCMSLFNSPPLQN